MQTPTLALLLVMTACAAESNAVSRSPITCAEASQLIEECVESANAGDATHADCEDRVEEASALCPGGKADGWSNWMCRIGVLRYCETPVCEAAPSLRADACAAYIGTDGCGSCDYYLCKEAAEDPRACGDEGYYVGFGHKYCERLTSVTGPRMSRAGQAWIAATRECLMKSIERDVTTDNSCPDIKRIAFDSHPSCYIDSGFCALPFSDWWSVLTTIDPKDFELQQIIVTGIGCLSGL